MSICMAVSHPRNRPCFAIPYKETSRWSSDMSLVKDDTELYVLFLTSGQCVFVLWLNLYLDVLFVLCTIHIWIGVTLFRVVLSHHTTAFSSLALCYVTIYELGPNIDWVFQDVVFYSCIHLRWVVSALSWSPLFSLFLFKMKGLAHFGRSAHRFENRVATAWRLWANERGKQ